MKSVYPFLYTEEQFERAAIIEYCGNLPRIEAEQLAREAVVQSLEVAPKERLILPNCLETLPQHMAPNRVEFLPPDWIAK